MGKKSRAERRHHHNRMIDRVRNFHWFKAWGLTEEDVDYKCKRMAETRKPCSCYMCGNPRKHWKDKTMQEYRFEEKMKADWNDDERG